MIGYTEFEAILARMFDVAEEDMSAFRARLRHLRYQGVPDKPRLGSGSRLKYEPVDLWECAVAMTLASYGFSPVRTVMVINRLRRDKIYDQVRMNEGDDLWLRMEVKGNVGRSTDVPAEILLGIDLMKLSGLMEWLDRVKSSLVVGRWHAVINISRLTREIER